MQTNPSVIQDNYNNSNPSYHNMVEIDKENKRGKHMKFMTPVVTHKLLEFERAIFRRLHDVLSVSSHPTNNKIDSKTRGRVQAEP